MRRVPTSIFTLLITAVALGLGVAPMANAVPSRNASGPKVTPLDQPVRGRTPYDQYLGPVRVVLQHLDGRHPPSMEDVSLLMRRAFQFEYSMTSSYRPKSPAVVEKRQAGDCKDKALWLADRMNDPNIRFIIGKGSSRLSLNHAWLLWKHAGQWWVLDPTFTDVPLPAAGFFGRQYIPYYGYSRESAYCFRTTKPQAFGVGVPDRREKARRRP